MYKKHKKNLFCGRWASLFFAFYNPFARLSLFFEKKIKKQEPKEISKILLCCQASLGDVLLASSIVPAIKDRWPEVKIGFLCTKESSSILKLQKEIDYIYEAPRWLIPGNGKFRNLFSLFFHNLGIYPKIVSEIRKVGYEISLELHPFFPNSLPLMKKAKIPRRVAFDAGGYGVWVTDLIPFPCRVRYLPFLYEELLSPLGLESRNLKANLNLPLQKKREFKSYIILHVGTSDSRKEWPSYKWNAVALDLQKQGFALVFTGKGPRDQLLIKEAFFDCLGANLCDQLDVGEMALWVKEAAAIISVDSFPVHLAALLEIPFIALYLYSETLELWLPENRSCFLLVGEKCFHICKKHVHSNVIYKEEITPLDVLTQFSILKKGIS